MCSTECHFLIGKCCCFWAKVLICAIKSWFLFLFVWQRDCDLLQANYAFFQLLLSGAEKKRDNMSTKNKHILLRLSGHNSSQYIFCSIALATQNIYASLFSKQLTWVQIAARRETKGSSSSMIMWRCTVVVVFYSILHALLGSLDVYRNLVHKEQEIQCKVKQGGSTKGRMEDKVKSFNTENKIFTCL